VGELLAEGVPPVLVFAGAERWFREDGVARVVRALLPDGDAGGQFLRYDARRTEDREGVSAAVDELRSRGLFGGNKVVLIENPEAATGPWAAGGRTSPITRLARAASEHPAEGTCLVLLTRRPVKGREAVPAKSLVGAGAAVVDCRALYDAPGPWQRNVPVHDHELSRHLVRRAAQAHGKRLALVDAHVLTRSVGSDLGDLDDALRSLALYAGEEERITGETIHAVVGATRTDPAWLLVDAVFERDRERALDLLDQALARGLGDAGGAAPVRGPEALFAYLAAALHGQYRKILRAAEALASGEEPAAVARAAGVPPFKAEAFLARCPRDPGPLLARHAAFFEAEAGVKSGRVPARVALERLVLALVV
jgi:DNA polymerase III delta subunit